MSKPRFKIKPKPPLIVKEITLEKDSEADMIDQIEDVDNIPKHKRCSLPHKEPLGMVTSSFNSESIYSQESIDEYFMSLESTKVPGAPPPSLKSLKDDDSDSFFSDEEILGTLD